VAQGYGSTVLASREIAWPRESYGLATLATCGTSARADAFAARDRRMRDILDRAAARGDDPCRRGHTPAHRPGARAGRPLLPHPRRPIPDDVLTGIVDNILPATHRGQLTIRLVEHPGRHLARAERSRYRIFHH
jgi:hypothetical protein